MKIQNPHDKFFKETFSNLEITKDFIKNYLPVSVLEMIDLETLDIQKDSYVDGNMKEVFSDMLFQAKINHREGYLYFLFEHKSYTSRTVVLQLLNYMVKIWEQKSIKENKKQIPVIIPLLIYHGKEKWEIGNQLSDLITDYEALPKDLKKMIPNFSYQIYDLSQFSDEDIKGDAKLTITLSIFRDIFKKTGSEFMKTMIRAAEAINELEEKETGIQYFETCLRYILNTGPQISKDQINTVLKQIKETYSEGSDVAMTMADVLRQEGREKGREEGLEEGLEQGLEIGLKKGESKTLFEMVELVLTKKFGPLSAQDQKRLSALSSASLKLIIEGFWECESLEIVKQKYF